MSFECRVSQVVRLTTHTGNPVDCWLTLGEVVAVHIDTDLLDDGEYQTARARPVLRGGGPSAYYEVSDDSAST